MTLAALLALGLAQDDAAAEALLNAALDRVASARTLRATLTIATDGRAGLESIRLSILLKGDDRWRVESPPSDLFDGEGLNLVCDGRKVLPLTPLGRAADRANLPTPLGGAAMFRDALRTSSLALLFYGRGGLRTDVPGSPRFEKAKDGGTETRDGRELRVVQATLKLDGLMRGEAVPFRILIDPKSKTLVRREIAAFGTSFVETIDPLVLDEELADAEFAFQTLRRLNRARAEQAAAAVDLFTRYTGRLPRTLADLAARPAWLDPDVFYPAAGFLLGPAPLDPWSRPFEIVHDKGRPFLAGRGADGAPDGRDDAEDALVPLRIPTGRAIGAPSDRLRRHFETRVKLQLLAAAVRGYAAAYGDLPRKKAALWSRGEEAEVWPAGGWIPEGLPADGWGETLRVVTEEDVVRAQVQDPRTRRIGVKALTAEERAGLEASARFRLSADERAGLERLFDSLREEDFEAREKADDALRAMGPIVAGPIEERLRSEKDSEARARLGAIRKSLKIPAPSWPLELGALTTSVGRGGGSQEGDGTRSATASLKTLASAQADFRGNDRDGNRANDFWTGDVAGLYTVEAGGERIKLIEVSVAGADAAPLNEGAALEGVVERAAKSGYLFRAMARDLSGDRPEAYNDGSNRHPSKFGFCAYPEEYGVGGTMTAIINEGNTIFLKDTGGEPVMDWPTDDELRTWSRLDR